MPQPTHPPRVRPDESLLRPFAQAPGLPFAEVLSTTQLHQVLVDGQMTYRERLFAPLATVATFLTQVLAPDHSMRQAVAQLSAPRASLRLPACAPGNRAYRQARQRLPESVFAALTRRTGRDLLLETPARWCWRGHDVKVVDGTT